MKKETTVFCPERGLIDQKEFLLKIHSANFPIMTDNKGISYYDIPAAFDIEVSSFRLNDEKCACMYIWQFGIMNWVTYGRTWDEFKTFLNLLSRVLNLSESMKLVVYVHNLAYEWQFIRKQFKWDKVFFLDERKPVYAHMGGYEFKCSLKLSSKSLEKVGEDLVKYKEHKCVGSLNYQWIRFHSTPLTEEELGYCEADIRVLLAYIQEKIETDGSICYIPMTNTGYVRNKCRKACFARYKQYRRFMDELTLEPEEYVMLKRGFSGGFTHGCAKYVAQGKEAPLKNVGSFDFTSSYPAVMLTENFPMSKGVWVNKIDDWNQFHWYMEHYCCLFEITFYDLNPKVDYDHPISFSKALLPDNKEEKDKLVRGMTIDNGRIRSADEITLVITEQDMYTIEEFYNFEDYVISKFIYYEKGYLPKALYKSVLSFYKDKTKLKDVAGEEINYMISKNMANSSYGMMVTDIMRDILEYNYESNIYLPKKKPNIDDVIEQYNTSKKRFLFYPWGVWITAYARRNLFSGIMACGNDYIYSDTDSIKIFNPDKHMDYINSYNENMLKKIEIAAHHYRIDVSEYSPENIYHEAKTIGIWEYEGLYKRFKTLGAKRYLVELDSTNPKYKKAISKKGHPYVLTTAGVNKDKACDYLVALDPKNPFKNFTSELCVPADYSGRLTLTYIDEPCDGYMKDYLGHEEHFHEESFIHMEPSEYNLTMSAQYKRFLNFMYGITEDSW